MYNLLFDVADPRLRDTGFNMGPVIAIILVTFVLSLTGLIILIAVKKKNNRNQS